MSGDWWVVLASIPLPFLAERVGYRERGRIARRGVGRAVSRARGPPSRGGRQPDQGRRRHAPAVSSVCAGLGWAEPLWLETTIDDPGTGQARDAVERGADVVLACGGDGTVRAVAEALAGTGVAMGLVAAGTGNLLARTIGTPQEVVAATRVALSGDDRKIDVGRVRVDDDRHERVFLVMAGTGFDAAIWPTPGKGSRCGSGRWPT